MARVLAAGLLVVLLCMGSCGQAQELFQESIRAQLEELDLGQLLRFTETLEEGYRELVPSLHWRDLTAGATTSRSVGELLALLLQSFLGELSLSLALLRQLLVIGILAALLQRLSTSFGSKMVVDLAFAVCFFVLVLLGLQSFRLAAGIAQETVDTMVSFMHSLLPMLATLLVAVGGVTSAAVFHPLLWALVTTIASLVQHLLLPLILLSTAFSLVSSFSSEFAFPKLGGLLRQAVITILGVMFIVFSGFMVVRGAIAPITDGISLRTAKYLTKAFIPIAGGMFADSLEVVVGGSLLIKNAVGIFGLVMILCLMAAPLLKVLAMVFIYKLVGALLEPISDRRLLQALAVLESSLVLVMIALGTAALMFFLAITILVGIGNLAVFMR
ncbi:MAG: stage III sporulation protein AE [Limnochordia bacterium]|nr:stage III sporulation protein AE [Limnochordia bacterium]MDI9465304.1 stage III sporulation protein AE [Bacillota bacterium]NLO95621.1 stage III sporulation protein AE [Bacillota bacterium]HAI52594.1 stage III sporulation protein AE [Bacillota bacterium]HOB40012.1 stage III sporulation protein AE [Limnochordia bacterium]